ncbi:MAG: efflux RND transporter periplasmic adaptor subunit [Hyphomicrobiaceae bacterium]|nr:efflux RND transporter periplasmic adaptor subunit [Hyphomicrobiaceae bacterium]
MKWSRLLLVGLVAAAAAGGGYVYWDKHKEALLAKYAARKAPEPEQDAAARAPTISVVRVSNADFVETVLVSGSLVPREETLVSPEIEGFRVVDLLADAGDEVKKGQVLARLVSDQLDAQLAQNEANLAGADASIARSRSQITEAEARANEAQSQLDRAIPLKKSGYLSGSVFDERESAARTSKAIVIAARDALKSAEAQKLQVEAQRRELEWKRSNTQVTSPVDGIVSRRNARIGAIASAAGDPMFRIIQKGEIELDAEVIETDIIKVKEGQKAIVTVPGVGEYDGTVRLVSPEIDKTTRLGRVRIFLGKKPELRVGSFARATIETGRSHGIAVAPSSIMFDPSGTYVQIVVDDKVARRDIKTGLVASGLVEVTSGLSEGDVIVERSGTFLRDGDVIKPVFASEKTAEVK